MCSVVNTAPSCWGSGEPPKVGNLHFINVHSLARFLGKVEVPQTASERTQGGLGTLNLEVSVREKGPRWWSLPRVLLNGNKHEKPSKWQWFQPSHQRLTVSPLCSLYLSLAIILPFILKMDATSEDLRCLLLGPKFKKKQQKQQSAELQTG